MSEKQQRKAAKRLREALYDLDRIVWTAHDGTKATRRLVESLREEQQGCCAICQRSVILVVDHCHQGLFVRGLLCYRCNTGLGLFKDDPRLLAAALVYLQDRQGPR